jgi:hypothetical protein
VAEEVAEERRRRRQREIDNRRDRTLALEQSFLNVFELLKNLVAS